MTERQTDQQVNNGGWAGAGSEDRMDRGEGNQPRGEMEENDRGTLKTTSEREDKQKRGCVRR